MQDCSSSLPAWVVAFPRAHPVPHLSPRLHFIRAADRPVYLPIGYEFDGAWNHYDPIRYDPVRYDPVRYVVAFRHIVDRLRANGVENFVTVWQSATFGSTYLNYRWEKWYPGDDYVDWFGTSYFEFIRTVHDAFLNLARSHGYWGDSRIQANVEMQARWLEQLGNSFWLQGGEGLFGELGRTGR